MSLLNSILANTLGVVWSAASGTVDPWTKANLVEEAQAEIVQAMGPNADPGAVNAAKTSQAQVVDSYLTSVQANSTDFLHGLGQSLGQFNPANWSNKAIFMSALIVVAVLGGLFFLLKASSRVTV